jgi:hypothetical protein
VPYICDYNASINANPRFREIPACHGIDWKVAQDPSSTSLHPDEAATLLQEWLFFAALEGLCNLFGVDFDPLDFVSSSLEAEPVVTGVNFRQYVWFSAS